MGIRQLPTALPEVAPAEQQPTRGSWRPLAGWATALVVLAVLAAAHRPGDDVLAEATTAALTGLAAALCAFRIRFETESRATWLALALGLALWSLTTLVQILRESPTVANAGMLCFSLAAVVALALLFSRSPRAWNSLPDATIAFLGLATIWSLLVIDRIAGDSPASRIESIATAYASLDLLGMALALALLARRGWRIDLQVLGLFAGLALIAIGDVALLDPVAGRAGAHGALGALWPAGAILLGAAAWLPRGELRPGLLGGSGLSLTISAAGATAALAVLALDHFAPANTVTFVLALLTMAAAIAHAVAIHAERDRAAATLRSEATKTVGALALAVDAKDPYTRHHSERVSHWAVAIGEQLALSQRRIERLRVAGRLHDVGKIAVPDALLLKAEQLTSDEYDQVKLHAERGERLARAAGLEDIARWIRHHHERWDGRGYPDRLAYGQIPLEARIVAVADAFDAMTSARSYRRGLGMEAARAEIAAGAGTQFDPRVARALLAITADDGSHGALASAMSAPQLPAPIDVVTV